jgi:hypothetical protein
MRFGCGLTAEHGYNHGSGCGLELRGGELTQCIALTVKVSDKLRNGQPIV